MPGAALAASQQFGFSQTDVMLVDNHGAVNVMWANAEAPWKGPVPLHA